jgi:signal transduction histidine kinase
MLKLSGVVLQKQKQQNRQDLLSQTLQIMTQESDVDETIQAIVDLLHQSIQLSCCFFVENTASQEKKIRYIAKTTKNCVDFLDSSRKIANYYHSCLLNKDRSFWHDLELPLAKPITHKLTDSSPFSPLLLVPVSYQKNYYGTFVLHHRTENYIWQEAKKNEVNYVAIQCGIVFDRQQSIEKNQQQEQRIQELEAKQRNEIQEASKRKLFIDHLTHELRTPLTSVLGFSRYLLEEIFGELNPKQKQYVNAIHDSGKHLLEIVNDYLDISKIEADRESLFIERIVVEDICRASLSIVEALVDKTNIELVIEIDPRTDFCFADSTRLKQILVNLLSNAIKFTETGTIALKVELKDDRLEFSVIDTGIGIAEKDKDRLFEPFQQLNNQINRRKKGSGLGLVLSQKLARLHGGDLTMTSEFGKGSCFTVHLPLQNK